ncbi:MAG: hypothetical protein R3F43_31405 [bacterium]
MIQGMVVAPILPDESVGGVPIPQRGRHPHPRRPARGSPGGRQVL